jgi:hypothetical protein
MNYLAQYRKQQINPKKLADAKGIVLLDDPTARLTSDLEWLQAANYVAERDRRDMERLYASKAFPV